MPDVVDKQTRSRMMSGIRGKNTKPEMIIRSGLHRAGFRFRLHVRTLPGKPDIVLPKYRAVIFVHGCFWHGHDCHLFKVPQTRTEWWLAKINRNRENDRIGLESLHITGWRVAEVWECALKGKERLPVDRIILCLAEWITNNDSNLLTIRGQVSHG